jgi:hypothetical protein
MAPILARKAIKPLERSNFEQWEAKMKKTIFYCDRCNTEIETSNYTFTLREKERLYRVRLPARLEHCEGPVPSVSEPIQQTAYDLCLYCQFEIMHVCTPLKGGQQ